MPNLTPLQDKSPAFQFGRWWLFFWLTIANTYLAYGDGSLEARLWVGLIGLVMPISLLILQNKSITRSGNPFPRKELFSQPPPFVFLVLFAAAVLVRFYKITSLSVWPLWDDSYFSFSGLTQAEHWRWQVFFGCEHDMPLYVWILGLYFKFLEPSLLTMGLYPILYSILVLPLAYKTIRSFSSASFSFVYTGLLAFSFWPLISSRASVDLVLCLIWQYVTLWVLGYFLRALKSGKNIHGKAALLGLCIGVGSYTSKFWLPNLVGFTLIAAFFMLQRPAPRAKMLSFFMVSWLVPVSFIWFLTFSHHFGGHIRDTLFFLQPHFSWIDQLSISFKYITGPFWGIGEKRISTFGPFWGGLLNPLLVSAFLIGLLELLREKKLYYFIWIVFIGGIYFGPGVISNNVEMMRIFSVLPFLLYAVAEGCHVLLSEIPPKRRILGWVFFMALSFGLDLFHLLVPYHVYSMPVNSESEAKDPAAYSSYQVLTKARRPPGPGLILTDLLPDVYDETLTVATYSLNAERNPKFSPREATWACLLVKTEYRDYLSKRFPEAKYYPLNHGISPFNGPTMLFIIPITQRNQETLLEWSALNRRVQDLYPIIYYPDNNSKIEFQRAFQPLYPLFKKDEFLESLYCWKMIFFSPDEMNHALAEDTLRRFAPRQKELSYLTPLLGRICFRLGWYYKYQQNPERARMYFARAVSYDKKLMPDEVREYFMEMVRRKNHF